jgi:hypothetical protein
VDSTGATSTSAGAGVGNDNSGAFETVLAEVRTRRDFLEGVSLTRDDLGFFSLGP